MALETILSPDRLILGLRARDKTQLLEELARRAAEDTALPAEAVLAPLAERERLGSTGLGKGFALPHVRLPGLDRLLGFLVRLARPIDFEAIDGRPVDVVFLLLMPEEKQQEHIAALAAVARLMRDPAALPLIRKARSAAALHATITEL